ncbi:BRISC and BRCA1-A complex member 1-like [Cydia pomonella]|uniref:BRISC and BRCA1-A complex member 1-like n=1 Tax=Cydia pomonella TaxID=82600 RepID=UPI002ADE2F42|nr:BRISC and BRCA1-A complex member 1-like [Cydia pomonella]
MDSPEMISSSNSNTAEDSNDLGHADSINKFSSDHISELQQQVIANFQKPNLPNVNVPERIIICLDVCYDDNNSLYRLGDGTTFSPINMMKRILDFFLHSKHAINRQTEFALLIMKDTEPLWVQNFTNNLKDIFNAIDYINAEGCTSETFDFKKVFQIVKQKVEIPEYKQEECILPPPFVVRMLVLYGRSYCIPLIPQDDPYFIFLRKQIYFYIDILLAHEENCRENKCEEIYDALQDLDNGYSYVYEVSRNATKIHDCIAKLLAHPLQRPLQRLANYTFGVRQ